ALRDIARLTGGSYFRARNSNELQSIYALLAELEPTERDAQIFRPQQNLYHWPLLLAFVLSLLLALQQSGGLPALRRSAPCMKPALCSAACCSTRNSCICCGPGGCWRCCRRYGRAGVCGSAGPVPASGVR